MNNTTDSPPIDPDERLSAAFDGEVPHSADSASEAAAQWQSVWSAARRALKALPVADVDLVTAVRTEIDRQTAGPSLKRLDSREKRTSLRAWIAIAASVAAVLLLFVVPRINNSIDVIPADPAFVETLQRLRNQADDPGTWNVVVLTVDHGTNLDVAMRGVMDDAERQGSTVMRLNRKDDANAEFSAGVLLTSGTAPQAMLDSLIHGESAEWNPAQIGTHSRDDLKRKFLASLEVPTRSDDVFGTMFVVGEDDHTVIKRELAKSSNVAAAQPMDSARAQEESVAIAAAADGQAPSESLNNPSGDRAARAPSARSVPSDTSLSEAPEASIVAAAPAKPSASGPVLVIIRVRPPVAPEAVPAGEPHGKTEALPESGQLAV